MTPGSRTTPLVGVGIALLLGVSACGTPGGAERAAPSGATSAHETEPAGRTTRVGCAEARQGTADPATDDDLVEGALEYAGMANGYRTVDGRPMEPDADGRSYYKIGARVTVPGTAVTVSIGDAAREYATIVTERGRTGGYSAVTFSSCDDLPAHAVDWWVGGFVLSGRTSGCVPLTFTASDGSQIGHFDLALPMGACD